MERKVSCLNARLDKQVLFKERSGNIDSNVMTVIDSNVVSNGKVSHQKK